MVHLDAFLFHFLLPSCRLHRRTYDLGGCCGLLSVQSMLLFLLLLAGMLSEYWIRTLLPTHLQTRPRPAAGQPAHGQT
jgi:hypothetical protein